MKKKFLTLTLAVAMCFTVLTACGKDDSSKDEKTTTAATEEITTEEEKTEAETTFESQKVTLMDADRPVDFEVVDAKVIKPTDKDVTLLAITVNITNNGSDDVARKHYNFIIHRNGESYFNYDYGTDESGHEWVSDFPDTLTAGQTVEMVIVLDAQGDTSTPVELSWSDFGENKVEVTVGFE